MKRILAFLALASCAFAGTWMSSPGKGSHAAAGGGGGSPTVVQTKTGNSTLATTAATWNTSATAGNLLIILVASDDYNATPPTGFTESTGCGQESFLGHYLWWKVAAGGETSVNYTIGSAVISAWATMEISGLQASPYDISSGQNTTAGGAAYTTTSLTPTSGNRYLIASIAGNDAAGATATLDTWLNSFTERVDSTGASGSGEVVGAADFTVTANGSTAYSSGATYTGAAIDGRSAIIISFKD